MTLAGLTKTFSDPYGNTYMSAYFVIERYQAHFIYRTAEIHVAVYRDSTSLTAGMSPVASIVYMVFPTAYARESDGFIIPPFASAFPPAISSGYGFDVAAFTGWLKTTPEMAGAT